MYAFDVRVKKVVHPLLLKQNPAYRRIPLDLQPSIWDYISPKAIWMVLISPLAQNALELLSVALVLSTVQSSRPHGERRIIHHRTQDVAARNDTY